MDRVLREAMVGLDEHANGGIYPLDNPTAGPFAGFELVANGAGPAAGSA